MSNYVQLYAIMLVVFVYLDDSMFLIENEEVEIINKPLFFSVSLAVCYVELIWPYKVGVLQITPVNL